jgi:DNA-binding response OmpR family regulator
MSAPDMLLVEDDTALAELLIWHFEREGFAAACAAPMQPPMCRSSC